MSYYSRFASTDAQVYALNLFRETIAECQGLSQMSLDDLRNSQFGLLDIYTTSPAQNRP